jgi:hypothetical protein
MPNNLTRTCKCGNTFLSLKGRVCPECQSIKRRESLSRARRKQQFKRELESIRCQARKVELKIDKILRSRDDNQL